MNTYQREHADTFRLVVDYLAAKPAAERQYLLDITAAYVDFRRKLDAFHRDHVADLCSAKCYQTGLSACCSRDSIVVYFADVVVNCLHSSDAQINQISAVLRRANHGHRCIHLGPEGCRWRISPIVCAMFLCDEAQTLITTESGQAAERWRALQEERKLFTWPDRPVIFDALEARFIAAGLNSPLMHLNSSPGLLSIKRKAGLF